MFLAGFSTDLGWSHSQLTHKLTFREMFSPGWPPLRGWHGRTCLFLGCFILKSWSVSFPTGSRLRSKTGKVQMSGPRIASSQSTHSSPKPHSVAQDIPRGSRDSRLAATEGCPDLMSTEYLEGEAVLQLSVHPKIQSHLDCG